MMGAFTWGQGGQMLNSDDAMRRRARIAEMLLQSGLSNQPAQHWSDGLSRGLNILAAGYFDKQNRDAEGAGKQALSGEIAKLLGGATASTQPESGAQAQAAPQQTTPIAAPAQSLSPPGNIPEGMRASSGLVEMIEKQNAQAGLPAGYLARTAQIESGMNPTAANPNSSAKGLFQFIDSTRKQYGGFNPMDPAASTEAAARLASDNKAILARAIGREPTAGELYLAHQQGAGGASKLLANPNARAIDVVGADALRLNGGNPNMTAGEFANKWVGKFGEGQPAAPPAQPAQVAQAASGGSERLRAAYNVMNSPFAGPADKAIAQTVIQKALTAEAKDPMDVRLKQAQVQQAESQASMTPLQRRQQEIAVQKGERDLMPDGARPLTPEERQSFGFQQDQAGYFDTKLGKPVAIGTQKTALTLDNRQESEFGKETGKALAKRFDSLANEGDEAVQNQVLVDEMRRLGGKIGTGASAAFKKRVGDLGIKLEGAGDIEAYSALIDRLTPQQRVPGSGATSDFDAKMFKGSLPALINTPEGNSLIVDTMEKLNANKMARGDIAMRVQAGDLKPNEGIAEIRKLQAEARALSEQFKDAAKPKDGEVNRKATQQPGKVLRYNPKTGALE